MKKFKALKTSVMASLMGAAVLLSVGQVANANCSLVPGPYDDSYMIQVNSNPPSYPSYDGFLKTLQRTPSVFDLVDASHRGPDPAVTAPGDNQTVFLYTEEDESKDGAESVSLIERQISYVPPATRDGRKFPVSDFGKQLERDYRNSQGLKGAAYIVSTVDYTADLVKFAQAIPACNDPKSPVQALKRPAWGSAGTQRGTRAAPAPVVVPTAAAR